VNTIATIMLGKRFIPQVTLALIFFYAKVGFLASTSKQSALKG
jgi:hypothetical protein